MPRPGARAYGSRAAGPPPAWLVARARANRMHVVGNGAAPLSSPLFSCCSQLWVGRPLFGVCGGAGGGGAGRGARKEGRAGTKVVSRAARRRGGARRGARPLRRAGPACWRRPSPWMHVRQKRSAPQEGKAGRRGPSWGVPVGRGPRARHGACTRGSCSEGGRVLEGVPGAVQVVHVA
ncbi:MAG: hypothetical protein J3K34DRAFT_441311 [Monoraphidium minutum]|nr:MAG: hypothetical protein J3K34DRAFT_441311 [Monoraphidium minutum]